MLCNQCLGHRLVFAVWLPQTPEGNFDHDAGVVDHVGDVLPRCLDCDASCVALCPTNDRSIILARQKEGA